MTPPHQDTHPSSEAVSQGTAANRLFWGLALFGLASLLVSQSDWFNRESNPSESLQSGVAQGAKVAIEGVDLASFRYGRLSMGLEAEQFQVRANSEPGTALATNAAPIDGRARSGGDQLLMRGARLQLYLDASADSLAQAVRDWKGAGSEPGTARAGSVVDALFSEFSELEQVVIWDAQEFEIELFRGLDRELVVKAATASGQPGRPRIAFTDVTIEHPPSGRVIHSPTVWWESAGERLIIPDGYEERTVQGVTQGGAISLGLDFVARPLSNGG